MDELVNNNASQALVKKWGKIVEGIEDTHVRATTAILLENQAKAIIHDQNINEAAVGAGTTTVGGLGTFNKFAFPLVRRVYPELIFNKLGATQPMQGPVSQIFYLGTNRVSGANVENIYSKYNLTYKGGTGHAIGSASGLTDHDGTFYSGSRAGSGLTGDWARQNGGFDVSTLLRDTDGSPSSTYDGDIASWPDDSTTLGWSVSAGERLEGTSIPEMQMIIQNQAVVAKTRKMRTLWTIEASQDLKAYHDIDLERELTTMLSDELQLEIDRELIQDMRMIAYGLDKTDGVGGWIPQTLDNATANDFKETYGKDPNGNTGFIPGDFQYDQAAHPDIPTSNAATNNNVYIFDLLDHVSQNTTENLNFSPQHLGHVYANLLALLNFVSQDIYKSTQRSPGSWIVTSPIVAAMLESASKLEGGVASTDKPTNNSGAAIEFKGKFAGKYDLFVDPLFPEDEIMMGRKGSGPMDSGFCYCPYIPLQQIPTVVDPESFQPRKGILTRYGKAAVSPQSRHFRIIRIVGGTASNMIFPFVQSNGINF